MSCSLIDSDFPGSSEALGVGLVFGMRGMVGVMYGTHGSDMAPPLAGILNLRREESDQRTRGAASTRTKAPTARTEATQKRNEKQHEERVDAEH